MNTTSRILDQCMDLKKELLLSAHLMLRLDLPIIYKSHECGKINLKGKESSLELFTIEEAEIKPAL